MGYPWTFPGGRFVSNKETLGAVADKSFTVPSNCLWKMIGVMYIERDASATLDIALYDPDDLLVTEMVSQFGAGTGNISIPGSLIGVADNLENWLIFKDLVLAEDWYVKITWGATQTSPVVEFPVLEIDV